MGKDQSDERDMIMFKQELAKAQFEEDSDLDSDSQYDIEIDD